LIELGSFVPRGVLDYSLAKAREEHVTGRSKQFAVSWRLTCVIVGAFALVATLADAQEAATSNEKPAQPASVFDSVGRWFDEQAASINSKFKNARDKLENLGEQAGTAAKSTAEGAKSAADAVVRIPNARVIGGHEKCRITNGVPDCVAAAQTICKAQGFGSGKSLDMTTAENCPPKVYIAGRSSGPECKSETFVARALCQ
jgi:hypothetical protein